MVKILTIILAILFTGIFLFLCLFLFILASIADDYWDEVKADLEQKK